LIELASWLIQQRRGAKMSLAALSERTKIMVKYLEALEEGDLEGLPTLVHARAFALAYARACGADEEEALRRVAEALSPKAKAQEAPASKAKAAEAPLPPAAPSDAPAPEPQAPPALPGQALPWKTWAVVAAASVAFLFLLHTAVSCVKGSPSRPLEGSPAATAQVTAQVPSQTAAPQGLSPASQAEPAELALRSKRPCWVLLVVDGKRLPVVFLEPDKRERWMVQQKAVMLAGNIGAVRVWWRGDNLGYFGELGQRMNGVVFENGKPWRKDPAEDLALPPGVPSQAPK
jgi:cytoskeleton protein RodZ